MNRLPKWVRSAAVMAAVILSAVLSHYATLASQPKPQSALDIFGVRSGRPAYVYLESRYNEPFSIYFPHFIDGAEAAEFAQQHGESIVLSNGESVGADVFWDRLHVLWLVEDKEIPFDESQWLYRVTLAYIPYTRHLDAEAYRQECELHGIETIPDITFLVGSDGRIFYGGKVYTLPGEDGSSGIDQLFNLEFKASRQYIVEGKDKGIVNVNPE